MDDPFIYQHIGDVAGGQARSFAATAYELARLVATHGSERWGFEFFRGAPVFGTSPVFQQLHGRLETPGEELIG